MGTADNGIRISNEAVQAIGQALRQFGYASLGDDIVRSKAERLLESGVHYPQAGKDGYDVIDLFISRFLREGGLYETYHR